MKPILQQMYDYHYGGNLEDADANDRIKELERTARMVLENGCLLAVSELAQAVIKYDVATSCPFCSKLEWDSDGGGHHMHDDGCLFAIAYQVLTPEAEEPETIFSKDAKIIMRLANERLRSVDDDHLPALFNQIYRMWEPEPGVVTVSLQDHDGNVTPFVTVDLRECPSPEAEEKINGMDEAASAVETAQSLNIDDAVREVAQSGKNHDHDPNWYAIWGGMSFSATFGAGTNSASVKIVKMPSTKYGEMLYNASDYGHHIETFRTGPWVNRLLAHANELRHANKVKALEREVEKVAQKLVNFKEVDF